MTNLFLIADDSPGKRALLKGVLKHVKWDGKILEATTTEEATDLIEAHPNIGAAFIDYEMPTKNGPAVIRALRTKNPAAHIALVTATDSDRYKKDGVDAGADAFVCTTWEQDRMITTLENLLEEWKGMEGTKGTNGTEGTKE